MSIFGKLTLRNYRCFDWDNPATLTFRDGFTALVGQNNSGHGINATTSERRATENYLTNSGIQAVLGNEYQELGPYQLLKDLPKAWKKSDNWKIAREIPFDEIKETDLGKFLDAL